MGNPGTGHVDGRIGKTASGVAGNNQPVGNARAADCNGKWIAAGSDILMVTKMPVSLV